MGNSREGKPVRVERSAESIILRLEPAECALLMELCDRAEAALTRADHPAHERLFPDPYQGDDDASAEFVRFTRDSLQDQKATDVRLLRAGVTSGSGRHGLSDGDTLIVVSAEEVTGWLRALTTLRLVLASELGVFESGVSPALTASDPVFYEWAGYLQESLLSAWEG